MRHHCRRVQHNTDARREGGAIWSTFLSIPSWSSFFLLPLSKNREAVSSAGAKAAAALWARFYRTNQDRYDIHLEIAKTAKEADRGGGRGGKRSSEEIAKKVTVQGRGLRTYPFVDAFFPVT